MWLIAVVVDANHRQQQWDDLVTAVSQRQFDSEHQANQHYHDDHNDDLNDLFLTIYTQVLLQLPNLVFDLGTTYASSTYANMPSTTLMLLDGPTGAYPIFVANEYDDPAVLHSNDDDDGPRSIGFINERAGVGVDAGAGADASGPTITTPPDLGPNHHHHAHNQNHDNDQHNQHHPDHDHSHDHKHNEDDEHDYDDERPRSNASQRSPRQPSANLAANPAAAAAANPANPVVHLAPTQMPANPAPAAPEAVVSLQPETTIWMTTKSPPASGGGGRGAPSGSKPERAAEVRAEAGANEAWTRVEEPEMPILNTAAAAAERKRSGALGLLTGRKLLDFERIESYGTLCFDALMLQGLGPYFCGE
jgi:hypothetical protein